MTLYYILKYESKQCCNVGFFSFSVPIDGENSGLFVDLYVNWPKSTLLSGRLGYYYHISIEK